MSQTPLTVVWLKRLGQRVRSVSLACPAACGGGAPLRFRDELPHERLVGADLGTADENWLLAVAARSADWYSKVTGVPWTSEGKAMFIGRLTAISRHWSDASGHGLRRGWHLAGAPDAEPAPWTSKRERQICWPALSPRPVCRRQSDAVTRLVLGTPTCPGHFDLLRHGPNLGGMGVSRRMLLAWATAVYLCDPVTATNATNARYIRFRRAVEARHVAGQFDEHAWELGLVSVRGRIDRSA